jgi:Zn-dependent peptidase ImmA (M78 family)
MSKAIVVPGRSKVEIDQTAMSILSKFQISAIKKPEPVDIEYLFEIIIPEHYGIVTGYCDLSKLGNDVLGYTNAQSKMSYVDKSLSDSDDKITRRLFRSTIAHEIKHCVKHVQILNLFKSICKDKDDEGLYRREKSKIKPYEDPEWQAWFFAGALLMPNHHVLTLNKRGCSTEEMADIFDVNPAFMRSRIKRLGL